VEWEPVHLRVSRVSAMVYRLRIGVDGNRGLLWGLNGLVGATVFMHVCLCGVVESERSPSLCNLIIGKEKHRRLRFDAGFHVDVWVEWLKLEPSEV
jgi:hypothetical protein